MSAQAIEIAEAPAVTGPSTSTPATTGVRFAPDVEDALIQIATSERALDDVLARAERMHASGIAHDPHACLVCFGS